MRWLTAGDAVGAVDEAILRRSLAEGITNAIATGVPAERVDGLRAWDLAHMHQVILDGAHARVTSLERRIKELDTELRNARKNANGECDGELKELYLADARTALTRRRQVEGELQIAVAEAQDTELPSVFSTDVEYIVRALANLADGGEIADAAVNEALQTLFQGFRLEPAGRLLRWTVSVRLPVDGAVVLLGPIVGYVDNHALDGVGTQLGVDLVLARTLLGDETVEGHLRQPADKAAGILRRLCRVELRDRLNLPDRAADVLTRCPIGETVDAVLSHLGLAAPPGGVDPAFVERVVTTYTSPVQWRTMYATDVHDRQLIVNVLASLGGEASFDELVAACAESDLNLNDIYRVTRTVRGPSHEPLPPAVERLGNWRHVGSPDRRIRLFRCWVCGGGCTKVIRVPEILSNILCETCLTEPVEGAPTFPAAYLDLYGEGTGVGGRRYRRGSRTKRRRPA